MIYQIIRLDYYIANLIEARIKNFDNCQHCINVFDVCSKVEKAFISSKCKTKPCSCTYNICVKTDRFLKLKILQWNAFFYLWNLYIFCLIFCVNIGFYKFILLFACFVYTRKMRTIQNILLNGIENAAQKNHHNVIFYHWNVFFKDILLCMPSLIKFLFFLHSSHWDSLNRIFLR